MKILLIGGTKFVGPRVVDFLKRSDCEVKVFCRGNGTPNLPPDVEIIRGNRETIGEQRAAFEAFKPDVAINMIASNEEDTKAFVDTFKDIVSHAVVVSSASLYLAHGRLHLSEKGPHQEVPILETGELRERPIYEEEKTEKGKVEAVVTESGMSSTLIRLPPIYGPGDPKRRFYPMMMRMIAKRPFVLIGELQGAWRWTHGYVDNMAQAIAAAATHPGEGQRIYNVGEQQVPTVLERMNHLATVLEWDGDVVTMPDKDLPAHLKAPYDFRQHVVYDTSKIRKELDYREQFDYYEGMHEAALWYSENPPPHLAGQVFNYDTEDQARKDLREGKFKK